MIVKFSSNYNNYLIGFIFVFLTVLFLSFDSSGESVSLANLEYEIMGNEYFDENLQYHYRDDNQKYDKDEMVGYYNISNENETLLCDTAIFNFTVYDSFYIDFYKPDGVDFNILFSQSILNSYGNESSKTFRFASKDSYLLNDNGDEAFKDNFSLGQISLYYSLNNRIIMNPDGAGGLENRLYTDTVPNSQLVTLFDWEETTIIDADNSSGEFTRYTINIRNNFDFTNPELRNCQYIWLTNLNNSAIYIKDFGFITENDLIESYITANYEFKLLYGESNFLYSLNQSEVDYTVAVENIIGISAYDNVGNYHLIRGDIETVKGLATTYDYNIVQLRIHKIGFNLVGIIIPDPGQQFGSQSPILLVSDIFIGAQYDTYIPHRGIIIFLNENSLAFHYKGYFNVKNDQSDIIDGTYSRTALYNNPKKYYGMFQNIGWGNNTFVETAEDILDVNTPLHDLDAVKQTDAESEREEHEFYKISGDWGYFSKIKRGLNAVLTSMQLIGFSIIDLLGIFKAFFSDISSKLSLVISSVLDIINIMNVDIVPSLGGMTGLLTSMNGFLSAISSAIPNLASQITLAAVEAAIGIVSALLTDVYAFIQNEILDALVALLTVVVPPWMVAILDVILTVLGDVLTLITSIVSVFVNLVLFFVALILFVIDFFTFGLQVYLYSIIIFTMIRILSNISSNEGDIGKITYDCIYWLVIPLILIGKIFKSVAEIIASWTPGT